MEIDNKNNSADGVHSQDYYELENGKTVNIPDVDLANLQKSLEISKDDADGSVHPVSGTPIKVRRAGRTVRRR